MIQSFFDISFPNTQQKQQRGVIFLLSLVPLSLTGLNMLEFYHCSSYYGDSEDEKFLEFKVDYTF